MSLLDREWDSVEGPQRYAVGQPMGAYSSFAMLALTHHVIVHIASHRASINPKRLLYAVLGDDGFIANKKVALHYKDIFRYLGMEINPIKGFEGTVLEFAKQLWTINQINISPLGAKNIMLAIRFPEFIPAVLHELWVKRFPFFLNKKRKKLTPYSERRTESYIEQTPLIDWRSVVSLLRLYYGNGSKNQDHNVERLRSVKLHFRALMIFGPKSGL